MTPTDSFQPDTPSLAGREFVVAVSGGIAAYKVATVVSQLAQRGGGVTVAMTESATRFVGPTTFRALSGRDVLTSLWESPDAADPQHIGLTRQADILILAPATANMIGKIANGICDDLVSTMIIAADCPILLAPSMNDRMWAHPAVQENLTRLREFGCHFVGPLEGWLACRAVGPGRMADPDDIVSAANEILQLKPEA